MEARAHRTLRDKPKDRLTGHNILIRVAIRVKWAIIFRQVIILLILLADSLPGICKIILTKIEIIK